MTGGYNFMSPTGDNSARVDTPFVLGLRAKSEAFGQSPEELAVDFLGDVVATAPLFSRAMVRALDRILNDKIRVRQLSSPLGSSESDAQLATYLREVVHAVDDIGISVGCVSLLFVHTTFVAECFSRVQIDER